MWCQHEDATEWIYVAGIRKFIQVETNKNMRKKERNKTMVWWKWNSQEINENTCAGAVSLYFRLSSSFSSSLGCVLLRVFGVWGWESQRERERESECMGECVKHTLWPKLTGDVWHLHSHLWCICTMFLFVVCSKFNLLKLVRVCDTIQTEGKRRSVCVSGFVFAVRIALVAFLSQSLKLKREHLL